jgi:hypothetical protein
MNANWAEENLNTIRTLMERTSLYRRALAPISVVAGSLGIIAAGLAQVVGWTGKDYFAGYWMSVAAITGGVILLLMYRQAIKAGEKFWSPPTRRVAQAMLPLLVAGLILGILELGDLPGANPDSIRLAALWMILYGGALHSAGFFMRRGLKLLGWVYLILGSLCLFFQESGQIQWLNESRAHLVMGYAFGVNNLAYGLYLRLTSEPRETE